MQPTTESNNDNEIHYHRSDQLREMYPDHRMLEVFGTLTPTLSERTDYFSSQWESWRNNRVVLPMRYASFTEKTKLIKHLRQIGLENLWDYQIRNRTIRFRLPEHQALWMISCPNAIPTSTDDHNG